MAIAYATTHNLKLSFTTWVCPEWTVAAIVDGMQTYGYEGVELRVGKGHLHGIEIDSPLEYISEVRKQFDAAHLAVSCIASSYSFSSADIVERQKTISNVKKALRMADSIGAPYLRVFGGDIECPRHGARFNVKSGVALCLPATAPVPTYVVRVQGDEIQVGGA